MEKVSGSSPDSDFFQETFFYHCELLCFFLNAYYSILWLARRRSHEILKSCTVRRSSSVTIRVMLWSGAKIQWETSKQCPAGASLRPNRPGCGHFTVHASFTLLTIFRVGTGVLFLRSFVVRKAFFVEFPCATVASISSPSESVPTSLRWAVLSHAYEQSVSSNRSEKNDYWSLTSRSKIIAISFAA